MEWNSVCDPSALKLHVSTTLQKGTGECDSSQSLQSQ